MKNIDKIERVQRRATKMILKSDGDYDAGLQKLNLRSLQRIGFTAYVTFLYKILNGHLNLDMSDYLNLHSSDDHYTLRGFASD